MNKPRVAYIFERYPVLTQTFLQREVEGARAQVEVEIHAMLPCPKGTASSGEADYFHAWEAVKLVIALPRELLRDPKLLRDGWCLWRRHRFADRENFWATVWAVIYALCKAGQFRRHKPDLFHAVRATGPATAAALLARLCGIPFSFGAHAYDIYRHGGDAFLESKLRAASFVHTTTAAAEKYLHERAGSNDVKIVLARRGLTNLPEKTDRSMRKGSITLLSVGRLVPKKGHVHQIAACVLLKTWGVPFKARIVGEGPLRDELERAIEQEGLQNCVTLCGALSPDATDDAYREADIFWHTGIVDAEGDRDGLPNVIPEAFAHSLAVIASDLPGNTEAVTNEINGLVVDPADAEQLAKTVKRLAENAGLRCRLGENGRAWVEQNFLISRNAEVLVTAFRDAI